MADFFDSLCIELADSGASIAMIYPGRVSKNISSRALRADCNQTGEISVHEKDAMPVDTCARMIIQVVVNHKSEVVMTSQGNFG